MTPSAADAWATAARECRRLLAATLLMAIVRVLPARDIEVLLRVGDVADALQRARG